MSTELRRAERLLEMCVEARVEARVEVAEAAALLGELKALRAAHPAVCADRRDDDTTCSLPPSHPGWHASNPRYDAERQQVHAGSTWTPKRTASDFRMCRS